MIVLHHPLLRLCWTKQDPNNTPILMMDSWRLFPTFVFIMTIALWLKWRLLIDELHLDLEMQNLEIQIGNGWLDSFICCLMSHFLCFQFKNFYFLFWTPRWVLHMGVCPVPLHPDSITIWSVSVVITCLQYWETSLKCISICRRMRGKHYRRTLLLQ